MKTTPFRALIYRKGTEHFYSPPFDTISRSEERDLKSFPYNITHLTLPESGESALGSFTSWKKERVLQRTEEVMFAIEQRFSHGGKEVLRVGIICLVEVFPPSPDIRPHEMTFPGPRRDRYQLMTMLGCQPEPIFLITGSSRLTEIVKSVARAGDPLITFEEPSGVMNRTFIISDAETLHDIQCALSGEVAIVADGHHRLAAVREIAEEKSREGDRSWNSILAYVSPTVNNGLLIGGIHRVVSSSMPTKPELSSLKRFFDVEDAADQITGCGITVYDGVMRRLVPRNETVAEFNEVDFSVAPDVANKLIFRKCLNFTDKDIETLVTYTHDAEFARREVDEGRAFFSVFMPEWDIEVFAEKVSAGGLLPQKSTFFFPKVPSGIAINEPFG